MPPAGELFITFTVNTRSDAADAAPGDGVCEATAGSGNCTLRAAIQEANALRGAKTISLPAGVYSLTAPGDGEEAALTGDLDIWTNLKIVGAGAAATIIDACLLGDRVFQIEPLTATVEITGVTIENGSLASGDGGGLYTAGTLVLSHSRLISNTAATGQGGGLFTAAGGAATLSHVTISGNQADSGGGLAALGTAVHLASLSLEAVAVIANTANHTGLALMADYATGALTNVTISQHLGGPWPAVVNGPFSTLVFTNVTMADNAAGLNNLLGVIRLKNTLLAKNANGACLGPMTSLGHNADDDGTCLLAAAGDLSHASLLLDPLGDYGGATFTHRLPAGSLARDAGDMVGCPAYDQRDVTRPPAGACDIGAVEYAPGLDP